MGSKLTDIAWERAYMSVGGGTEIPSTGHCRAPGYTHNQLPEVRSLGTVRTAVPRAIHPQPVARGTEFEDS